MYVVENDEIRVIPSENEVINQIVQDILPKQAYIWIDGRKYQDFYFDWEPTKLFTSEAFIRLIRDFIERFQVVNHLYLGYEPTDLEQFRAEETKVYSTIWYVRQISFANRSLARKFGNTFKVSSALIDVNLEENEHYWENLARGSINPSIRPEAYYLEFNVDGFNNRHRVIKDKWREVLNKTAVLENTFFLVRDLVNGIEVADYVHQPQPVQVGYITTNTRVHYAFGDLRIIAERRRISSLTEHMAKYWLTAKMLVTLRIDPNKLGSFVSTLLQYLFPDNEYPAIGSAEYGIATSYFFHLMQMVKFFPRRYGDWAVYDNSMSMIQNTAVMMAWHVGSDYHLASQWIADTYQLYRPEPLLFDNKLKSYFYPLDYRDIGSGIAKKPWLHYLLEAGSVRFENLGSFVPSLLLHHYWVLQSVEKQIGPQYTYKELVAAPFRLTDIRDLFLRLGMRPTWISLFRWFMQAQSYDLNEHSAAFHGSGAHENLGFIFRKSLEYHLRQPMNEDDRSMELYPILVAVQAIAPLHTLTPTHLVVVPHEDYLDKSSLFLLAFRKSAWIVRGEKPNFEADWTNWYSQAAINHHVVPYDAIVLTLAWYHMFLFGYPETDFYKSLEWTRLIYNIDFSSPALLRYWLEPENIKGYRTLDSKMMLTDENQSANFWKLNVASVKLHQEAMRKNTALSVVWRPAQDVTYKTVVLPLLELVVERDENTENLILRVMRDKYGKPPKNFFFDILISQEIRDDIPVLHTWKQTTRTYADWEEWLRDKLRFFTLQQQQKMYEWYLDVSRNKPSLITSHRIPTVLDVTKYAKSKNARKMSDFGLNRDDFETRFYQSRPYWLKFLKIFGQISFTYKEYTLPAGNDKLPGMFVMFSCSGNIPMREFTFCIAKTNVGSAVHAFQRKLFDKEKIEKLWTRMQRENYKNSIFSTKVVMVKGRYKYEIEKHVKDRGQTSVIGFTRGMKS